MNWLKNVLNNSRKQWRIDILPRLKHMGVCQRNAQKGTFLASKRSHSCRRVFSSQAIQYISGKGRPSPKFSEYEKGKEMLLVRGDADVDLLPIRDRKQDLCRKSCIRHTATLLQQAIPRKKKVHSGGHPQGDIRASALPPVRLPDTPDDQGRQVQPS